MDQWAAQIGMKLFHSCGNLKERQSGRRKEVGLLSPEEIKVFRKSLGLTQHDLSELLWYSDFLSFKHNTVSISGTRYAHLPFGPCPDNYDVFIAYLTDIDKSLSVVEQSSGIYSWEVLVSSSTPDYSLFTNGEQGFQETSDGQILSFEFANGYLYDPSCGESASEEPEDNSHPVRR